MKEVNVAIRERERIAYDEDGRRHRSYEYETTSVKSSKPWVRVYLDAWATFKNVKGFSDVTCEVLYQILCLYPPAVRKAKERTEALGVKVVPTITPTMEDKHYWEVAIGTTLPVINNSITRLVKMGILTRVKRGSYLINPELIGCGTEVDMENLRKIKGTFEIGEDGSVIFPTFEGDLFADDDFE